MGICKQAQLNDYLEGQKRIEKLGKLCVSRGLAESDIHRADNIKHYRKEEIVDYVLDHNMNMKQLERVYKRSKVL